MRNFEGGESPSDKEARDRLYEVLHRTPPRKQAFERVVEIGSEYLGIEHGHVTSINTDDDRWQVIGSIDPLDGPYPDGMTGKLSESYCRHTIRQSSPLELTDAGQQGWSDDPAYQIHQLDTYLGMRIEVFGEPYGTVCFVQSEAREEPFSDAELFFIELAGQVLRDVIEESNYQKNLLNRDRLISVLNRILRHNLRNDLNVISGYINILKSTVSADARNSTEIIHRKITELHSIAEKSRELDALTRNVPVERPMNVVELTVDAVREIRNEYPSVSLSLESPDEAIAFAAPHFTKAVKELLENAAKHGGDRPDIDVKVYTRTEHVIVSIEDDGPGIPMQERKIFTEDEETALEHGSGIGLVLVYWIVTNIDGEIDVEASADGTAIELYLQRATPIAPETDRQ